MNGNRSFKDCACFTLIGVVDINGFVERIEYDPNRTAYIALITYEDKESLGKLFEGKLEERGSSKPYKIANTQHSFYQITCI